MVFSLEVPRRESRREINTSAYGPGGVPPILTRGPAFLTTLYSSKSSVFKPLARPGGVRVALDQSRFIRSIRDSLLYPALASVDPEIYQIDCF